VIKIIAVFISFLFLYGCNNRPLTTQELVQTSILKSHYKIIYLIEEKNGSSNSDYKTVVEDSVGDVLLLKHGDYEGEIKEVILLKKFPCAEGQPVITPNNIKDKW